MEQTSETTKYVNILLRLPVELNEAIAREAKREHRAHRAQIAYLLDKWNRENQRDAEATVAHSTAA